MDNKEESPKRNSRRDFIQNVGLAGLGSLAVGGALLAGYKYQKGKDSEKVRLLTTDGKLVELDSLELKDVAREALTEYQKRGRLGI